MTATDPVSMDDLLRALDELDASIAELQCDDVDLAIASREELSRALDDVELFLDRSE